MATQSFGSLMSGSAQSALSSASSSFGSGLGSGLSDVIFGGIRANRQWKYQQKAMALQQQYALEQMAKAAEYQLAHDKELFDYQNAYNEPTKVFSRYAKAGVTPAAVLGSSGVGVSATVPTGSGSAPSASGPTGGVAGSGSAMPGFSGNPTALAQIEMAKADVDRARAAASRDSAEAEYIRNQTQPKEYYSTMAELNRQISESNVDNAKAVSQMNAALASIYKAEAEYSDLIATYKFKDYMAQYAKHVEEYEQLRKYNVQYMDRVLGAQIVLDLARAYQSYQSGSLAGVESDIARVRYDDIRNWFEVNWDTKIPVPEVNENGKPTGKHIELTGKEIQAYLLGLDVAHGNQETASRWFSTRSEKNAFGYKLINTVVSGAVSAAGSYFGGRALGGALSTVGNERTLTERFDGRGNYIGGTLVHRESISERSRSK